MSLKPIEKAKSGTLRHSPTALARAAERARALAIQTNTLLVVSRAGFVIEIDPRTMQPAVKPDAK